MHLGIRRIRIGLDGQSVSRIYVAQFEQRMVCTIWDRFVGVFKRGRWFAVRSDYIHGELSQNGELPEPLDYGRSRLAGGLVGPFTRRMLK